VIHPNFTLQRERILAGVYKTRSTKRISRKCKEEAHDFSRGLLTRNRNAVLEREVASGPHCDAAAIVTSETIDTPSQRVDSEPVSHRFWAMVSWGCVQWLAVATILGEQ